MGYNDNISEVGGAEKADADKHWLLQFHGRNRKKAKHNKIFSQIV